MANPAPALLSRPDLAVKRAESQWQPGVSGNPAGRPPNQPMVTPVLRRLAAREQAPNAESVAEALLLKASSGDVFAAREVTERLDGKVPNPIQLTSVAVNLEIAAQYSDLAGNLRFGLAAGVFGQLVEIEGPEPSTDVPGETPDST